jgi:hypothetical protein
LRQQQPQIAHFQTPSEHPPKRMKTKSAKIPECGQRVVRISPNVFNKPHRHEIHHTGAIKAWPVASDLR